MHISIWRTQINILLLLNIIFKCFKFCFKSMCLGLNILLLKCSKMFNFLAVSFLIIPSSDVSTIISFFENLEHFNKITWSSEVQWDPCIVSLNWLFFKGEGLTSPLSACKSYEIQIDMGVLHWWDNKHLKMKGCKASKVANCSTHCSLP